MDPIDLIPILNTISPDQLKQILHLLDLKYTKILPQPAADAMKAAGILPEKLITVLKVLKNELAAKKVSETFSPCMPAPASSSQNPTPAAAFPSQHSPAASSSSDPPSNGLEDLNDHQKALLKQLDRAMAGHQVSDLHTHLLGMGDHAFWLRMITEIVPALEQRKKLEYYPNPKVLNHANILKRGFGFNDPFEWEVIRDLPDCWDKSLKDEVERLGRRFSAKCTFEVVYSIDAFQKALNAGSAEAVVAKLGDNKGFRDELNKRYIVFNARTQLFEYRQGIRNAMLLRFLESHHDVFYPVLANCFAMLETDASPPKPETYRAQFQTQFTPEFFPRRYELKDSIYSQYLEVLDHLLDHVLERYDRAGVGFVEFSMGFNDLIERPWVFRHLYNKIINNPFPKVNFRFLAGFNRMQSFKIGVKSKVAAKDRKPVILANLRKYLTENKAGPNDIDRLVTEGAADIAALFDDPGMFPIHLRQLQRFKERLSSPEGAQIMLQLVVGFDYMGDEKDHPFCPFALDDFIQTVNFIRANYNRRFGLRYHFGEFKYEPGIFTHPKHMDVGCRTISKIFSKERGVVGSETPLRIGHGVAFLYFRERMEIPDDDETVFSPFDRTVAQALKELQSGGSIEINLTSNEVLLAGSLNNSEAVRHFARTMSMPIFLCTDNDGIWQVDKIPYLSVAGEYAKAIQDGVIPDGVYLDEFISTGLKTRFFDLPHRSDSSLLTDSRGALLSVQDALPDTTRQMPLTGSVPPTTPLPHDNMGIVSILINCLPNRAFRAILNYHQAPFFPDFSVKFLSGTNSNSIHEGVFLENSVRKLFHTTTFTCRIDRIEPDRLIEETYTDGDITGKAWWRFELVKRQTHVSFECYLDRRQVIHSIGLFIAGNRFHQEFYQGLLFALKQHCENQSHTATTIPLSPHGKTTDPFSSSPPLNDTLVPICSSSDLHSLPNNQEQDSQTRNAHSQILRAALEFNQLVKAPRTGVTAADPALWGFSAGIQPSREAVDYLKRRFEIIRPQLLNIFEEILKDLPRSGDYPFEFKLEISQGGSVANQTYLTSPDLDLYLVINSSKSLRITPGGLQYVGNDDRIVNPAMVKMISDACCEAMTQFLSSQQESSPLQTTTVVLEGMTVFTLTEAAETFEGLRLEFDVVPVLRVIGGRFLLLDGQDGKLVPSSTQLAAHMIGVHAKDFLGLREMMVVLKLVHKAGIKQGLRSLASVSFCGLEMAVMLVVEEKREKAAAWWRDSSFTTIFRAAIAQLLDRISSGARLPAPNDPTDDVLRGIRSDSREFATYYTRWLGIDEAALLGELKTCFDLVRSSGHSVESPSNQPTCSLSEAGQVPVQVGSSIDPWPRPAESRSPAGSSSSSSSGLPSPLLSDHKFSQQLQAIDKKHAPETDNLSRALKMLLKSNVPSRFCTDLVAAVEYLVDQRPMTTVQELADCFKLIPGCAALSRDLKALSNSP